MWKFAQVNTLNYCILHPLGSKHRDGEISRSRRTHRGQRQRQKIKRQRQKIQRQRRKIQRQRQKIESRWRATFRDRNFGWGDGWWIRGRATREELADFPLVNRWRKKQSQRHTLDLFKLWRRVWLGRREWLVQSWDMYGFAFFDFVLGNLRTINRHFVHDSVFGCDKAPL